MDRGIVVHPLAYARRQRGWTLAKVAHLAGQGRNAATWRQKAYRWERGVTPEPDAQQALAAAFGIPEQAVQQLGWPDWLLLVDPPEPIITPWTADGAATALHAAVSSVAMDRRGFVVFGGTALAAMIGGWSTTPPPTVASGLAGNTIGSDVAEALNARVEQLWHLDDLLGGGPVLDAAIADLGLVEHLLTYGRYAEPAGLALWRSAAALARMAGWAAFDAGRMSAAQRLWHVALRAAHTGNDAGQGIYVLSNLGLQAIYSNDGQTAVEALTAARARCDPSHLVVQSMLDTWLARAHSVLGEHRTAATLLNRADDLWDRRRAGDDPDWIYWMPQPSTTAEAGTALLAIGELDAANRSLNEGISALGADSVREHTLYLIRLAEVALAQGDAERASAYARDALTGEVTRSHRIYHQLADVVRKLPDTNAAKDVRALKAEQH